MKQLLYIGMYFLPAMVFTQNTDSLRVVNEVDSMILASRNLCGQSKHNEALQIIYLAKDKTVEAFGAESAPYIKCLFNEARTFQTMKKYKDAEALYLKTKTIQEKVLGSEHADNASTLANLGYLYKEMGVYDRAESSLMEAKLILGKQTGEMKPDYVIVLNFLALLYKEKGEFDKADPYYIEILDIQEKKHGKSSLGYASALNNHAVSYEERGEYDKAEAMYMKVNTIRENMSGRELEYARGLNNLANLYYDKGDYDRAEQMNVKVLSIRKKMREKHPMEFVLGLKNFANFYRLLGQYNKAEPLYLEAKDLIEKLSGKENSYYVAIINDGGFLYNDMESFDKAEPLFLEAIALREKLSGKESLNYAQSLDNLALVYVNKGIFDKAESLYLESRKIQEKVSGKDQLNYAITLKNLAVLYKSMNDLDKAESFYLEAMSHQGKVLGNEHPKYANTLDDIATLYFSNGEYDKAEPLFIKEASIWGKVLGREHPYYATTLHNLAMLYKNKAEYDKAESFFVDASNIIKQILRKSATYLHGQELEKYVSSFRRQNNAFLTFNKYSTSDTLRMLSFNNALFYKGFGLETTLGLEKSIKSAPDSIQNIYSRWKDYNLRMALELTKPIAERKNVARLDSISIALEKTLLRATSAFAETRRQVEWLDVRDAIHDGEIAIEFIHYNNTDSKVVDSTMYAALVVHPSATAPKFIPLFEEREITPLLKGASGKAFARINGLYTVQPEDSGQKSLYELVWKPLEQELQGVKTIYCAPSGLLHKINLGAIPLQAGTFSRRYQVVVLGSTRKLVIPDQIARSGNEAQLFGGVRYTSDSTLLAAVHFESDGTRGLASEALPFRTDTTVRGDSWNYLPETAAEVRYIQNILQSKNWVAQLDTGYFATEEAFRSLGKGKPSPRLLHVATHGFFFPDPKTTQNERQRMMGGNEPVFRLSEHPLIRSGLILAGAQEAWSSGKPPENREDGILTAYEISQMNLSNTELVVLSACETGLGDIQGNEGVYGLQRAFKIAGAKYLIMSLWKVSDQSSREMMTEFYRQWLGKGLSIPEAFRKAQGNMKRKYPDAPYHWAGFVLVE